MSAFQRRHYIALADVLRDVRETAHAEQDLFLLTALPVVGEALIQTLMRDNHRFRPSQFRRVAKLPEKP